jgi:lipoprotein-anchoring transpeptidase ErfK/SrfK
MMILNGNHIFALEHNKQYYDYRERSVTKYKTSTNLINKTINVNIGETYNLDYKIAGKVVYANFYSSNTNVASVNVNDGIIYGRNPGSTTITINGKDNRVYKLKVNIAQTKVIVDISSQKAYLYVKGKLLRTASVVTGRAGVTPTPYGTFKIAYKTTNFTMDGRTVGYDYLLHVDYWIPLAGTGGVGLHDASWRSNNAFGGNYYKWDGSHGCINMKRADVAFFYKHLKAGDPVTIRY